MVGQKNRKHAFWQALVFAVVVFAVGLIMGFFLENNRANKIQFTLLNSEINILDDDLRNRIVSDFNISCDLALKSTFDFADKIYLEAGKLEQYDAASKFGDGLLILHKRYDLLRTLLWTEAIDLRKKCENDFHTVVYLYKYESEEINIDSMQLYYSRLLLDLKQKYPQEIILIPIAANTGLASVDLILENYGISEFPVVIIDENKIIDELVTFEEIEKVVFEDNNDFK
jgi:hypothetical protein